MVTVAVGTADEATPAHVTALDWVPEAVHGPGVHATAPNVE